MWVDYRGSLSTGYSNGEISNCGQVDYRGSLSTAYNDGEYTKSSLIMHTQLFWESH